MVHNPGHDLGIGIDVGGGDVEVQAEGETDALDEFACQAFECMLRELVRVAGDAALGAAKRHVDQRGLPSHQRGE